MNFDVRYLKRSRKHRWWLTGFISVFQDIEDRTLFDFFFQKRKILAPYLKGL